MALLYNFGSLNDDLINITFLYGNQTKCAQLPGNFELIDFIQVIQNIFGTTGVDNFHFFSNGIELVLFDPVLFQTNKHLIVNDCTIVAKKHWSK